MIVVVFVVLVDGGVMICQVQIGDALIVAARCRRVAATVTADAAAAASIHLVSPLAFCIHVGELVCITASNHRLIVMARSAATVGTKSRNHAASLAIVTRTQRWWRFAGGMAREISQLVDSRL